MKKLKTWQIVLLVIFYPAGICYLIYRLAKKNSGGTGEPSRIDSSNLSIIRDFHTKVVGVTFRNADGSDRQAIIKGCKIGDDIIFRPTPTAEYPDAVGVFNAKWQQLGNLNADLALEIKTNYPYNPMSVTICNITGGGEDYNLGCNLHIIIYAQQK